MIDFDKKTDIEIFDKLKTDSDEAPEIVELAGYQVTKAELFAHTKDPAITVWDNKIKFNMACLRKFPRCQSYSALDSSEATAPYHQTVPA